MIEGVTRNLPRDPTMNRRDLLMSGAGLALVGSQVLAREATGALVPPSWPQFRGNAMQTGVAAGKLKPALKVAWKFKTGKAIIVVSAMVMAESPAYARFLMAHECSHHTLGHVAAFHRELGHLGPQPIFYIAPQLKNMELDADCTAVKMLMFKKEPESVEAARVTMGKFGSKPTGASTRCARGARG